jgi:hypothetical protein
MRLGEDVVALVILSGKLAKILTKHLWTMSLGQWHSTVFVRMSPEVTPQLCIQQILVYNSSNTQSTLYIKNKLN